MQCEGDLVWGEYIENIHRMMCALWFKEAQSYHTLLLKTSYDIFTVFLSHFGAYFLSFMNEICAKLECTAFATLSFLFLSLSRAYLVLVGQT